MKLSWKSLGSCIVLLGLGVGAAEAAMLADHRALYAMSLARTTAGSSIQGLSGQMMLEVKSTCEGSTVTQMLKTDTWGDDDVVQNGELKAVSFEAKDGKTFRFSMRNNIDGAVDEEFKGEASRAGFEEEGTIVYEGEAFPTVALPAGAVFPMAYMERLLAAAEARERVLSVTVFDGADDGKIFRSTSIIGPRSEAAISDIAGISNLPHWPAVLSYFLLGSTDATPEYESSFDLYSNGVSDRLLLDYGDFAMRGELTSLQMLPMPKCKSE